MDDKYIILLAEALDASAGNYAASMIAIDSFARKYQIAKEAEDD